MSPILASLHIQKSNKIINSDTCSWVSMWCSGKESACQCRSCKSCGFNPWVGKIPWSRKWQSGPVFLPRKFLGERSLAGYSPWGHKSWAELSRAHTLLGSLHEIAVLSPSSRVSPSVCMSVLTSSSDENTCRARLRSTLVTSLQLNYLFKELVSRYCHALRCQGLEIHHISFEGTQIIP